MTARVGRALSVALVGLAPHPVEVVAEAVPVQKGFGSVGAGLSVAGTWPGREAWEREVKVRVRSALAQCGIDLRDAGCRVVVSAPCSPGGAADLAVAVAVAEAVGKLPADAASGLVLLGELALSGDVRPVRGLLPALGGHVPGGPVPLAIVPERGCEELGYLAPQNRERVRIAGHLSDVVGWLRGVRLTACPTLPGMLPPPLRDPVEPDPIPRALLAPLRAALENARAGRGTLLVGPPGSGKTMLARRVARLLGPIEVRADLLASAAICSAAGMARDGRTRARLFRAPHHTVSEAGLVGGGDPARPGEASLAHAGVLFLDELPEFRRAALEALAVARRAGVVTVRRRGLDAAFPARSALVAAANPCPCGYWGSESRLCRCFPEARERWDARLGELRSCLGLEVVAVPGMTVAEARDVVDVSGGLPPEERSAEA